jgi:4-amino-4-deoxy-L-arabinose transferase-like glycosyltransferase
VVGTTVAAEVEGGLGEPVPASVGRRGWTPFVIGVAAAVVLGAVIRLVYVLNFPTTNPLAVIGGDGLAYSSEANYLADGRGYVFGLGQTQEPSAHHPPGWVTLLSFVSRLGFRGVPEHQVFTTVLGLALIVAVAVLARKVFGVAPGIVAAFIAAVYPGFWVLEAQVLSETLGLLALVLLTIQLYRVRANLTVWGLVGVAVLTGAATLVRSEQFVTGAVVLGVVLLGQTAMAWPRRFAAGGLFLAIVVAMIAPWAIYNSTRFQEPVLLSSNMGTTLLAGNCRYGGVHRGFYTTECSSALAMREPAADRSVMDRLARQEALDNIRDNLSQMPRVLPARLGRALAIYKTPETVASVARWHGTTTGPVWAWVVSYWVLAPLAAVGLVVAWRRKVWVLPLLVPIVVAFGIVLVFYGEPRYHTPADASFVVLAGFGLVALARRVRSA